MKYFLLCIAILLGSFTGQHVNAEPLKIVVQENNVFLEAILPPLLKEAKLDAEFLTRPSERTLQELNAGHLHANGVRLRVISDLFPNIIKMEEPVEHIDFIAITNDPSVEINSWSDLAKYNIGYPHGWKLFDLNVPKDTKVIKTKKQIQLFQMLKLKRIDVVLLSKPIARTLLKEISLPDIRFLEPPLHKTPSFMFFHKSKSKEAEKMSEALKTLKANGIYDRTYQFVYDNQ